VIHERVTLIAADGRVLGDSEVGPDQLATVENHAGRDEIVEAGHTGAGTASRQSRTTGVETMYAAVPMAGRSIAYVRVALPLTVVNDRVAQLRRLALIGLLAGLAAAGLLTAAASSLLHRRLRVVLDLAARYKAGRLRPSRRRLWARRDRLVAGVIDDAVRQIGVQLAEMGRERAHRAPS